MLRNGLDFIKQTTFNWSNMDHRVIKWQCEIIGASRVGSPIPGDGKRAQLELFSANNPPQSTNVSPLPSPSKSPARTPMQPQKHPYCTALYDFEPENPGELGFKSCNWIQVGGYLEFEVDSLLLICNSAVMILLFFQLSTSKVVTPNTSSVFSSDFYFKMIVEESSI